MTRRKIILIAISIVLVLVTLITILSLTFRTPKSPDAHLSDNQESLPTQAIEDKNYALDTDKDNLPDFIEKRLSLDPAKNEVEACLNNKCSGPEFEKAYIKKHNIVIILDSSGSMSLKTGDVTKMDAAKEAIKSFINKAGDKAQIGLVVYGHLGSNSARDKAVSCAGADTLSPIGNLSSSNIDSVLSQIKPTGWTPIGLAIRKSQELFVGKEKDINELIVVTDGAETCDTDPVGAAAALASSNTHIKVHVIGFAVSDEETKGLKAISDAGQGSFESAKSASDLEDIFSRNRNNWTSLSNANECIQSVIDELNICTVGLHDKIETFRNTYARNSTVTIPREEYEANERVYYAFITYLQNFQSQKSSELIKQKNEFINKL